jgi:hypothetical protein
MRRLVNNLKNGRNLQSNSSTSINTMFNDFPDQILGGGFSSDMQMVTFPCLNINNVTFNGSSVSIVPLGASIPFDQFVSLLTSTFSPNNNLWIFSSNPESLFAQYSNDTVYTQSYYFTEFVTMPINIFTPNITNPLNQFGLGAYNAGPDQFRATCGDMFAVQEQLGAGLFITLQLVFNKQADKATFNAQAGTSLPSITDAFNTIQNITTTNKMNGYLEFLVFQSGGAATELIQILSNNPATGTYYLTTCSFSNTTICNGAINEVSSYAENNFPTQVGFQSGQPTGNPISLNFTYMNYTDLGFAVGNSVLTPESQEAMSNLAQTYLDMQAQIVLVNKVFSSQVGQNLEPITYNVLSNFTETVNYNNALITDPINGITGCYQTPINCLNIIENINNQLLLVNYTELNETLTAFQIGYMFSLGYSVGESLNTTVKYIPIGNNIYLPFDISSPSPIPPPIASQAIIITDENSTSLTLPTTYSWNNSPLPLSFASLTIPSSNVSLTNENIIDGSIIFCLFDYGLCITSGYNANINAIGLIMIDSGIF